MILFTQISQAALTIKPIDDDHSFSLIKENQDKTITNPITKNDSIYIKNKSCNYSTNDFRHKKNSEVGCAVNTNRKNPILMVTYAINPK